jgi:hypothetical protein
MTINPVSTTQDSPQPPSRAAAGSGLWTVKLERDGIRWSLTVEADTRQSAIERAGALHPTMEIKGCMEAPNNQAHA